MASSPLTRNTDALYADFPKDLLLNPVNFDISRKTDEAAIKESIKNILLTDPGERLFNPTFGCGVRHMLFENMHSGLKSVIEDTVRTAIETYEPRCNLLKVQAILDNYNLIINVVFTVINIQEPINLSVTLSRVR